MRLSHLICLLFLASAPVVFADPVISEFMASNKHTLADEDGDFSDWIEIRNPDAVAVNMNGWHLTDTASNLGEWTFPAVTIPAKGYLLLFASGKDRRVVGQNLHTNFEMKAGGEYLALVKPDGITKTTEFNPFPPQFTDVSYGTSSSTQTLIFCQQGTAAKAFVPSDNSLGTTWRALSFNDSTWTSGTLAAGYFDYNATSSPDLSSQIGLDLKTQMGGKQLSAYVRIPFTVSDITKVQQLTLLMNYDDGFAAFVNGQFVTSGNAPAVGTLAYNSLALGDHGPGTFETFDLSSQIGQLVNGANVLAIQGLNKAATSSDLFILPQLVAQVDTGATSVTGYFPIPTPGKANGGPDTVQLPQTITYSRVSGPFTTAFNLTISGAASGQQIRYIIADPTSSPGANIADPTISSTLYTGPISISTNKLIRAAVFDPTTGQKGATLTTEYLLLETGTTNNTSTFTSNLPIVVIDDHGGGQAVDSGTNADTTALFYLFNTLNGTATLNSTPTLFTRAGFAIHGSSSAGFPKKSYNVKFWDEKNGNSNNPVLGLASDHSWELIGPYNYDRTFIHNSFIYEVSRECGRWAPQTKMVEVFTNINGGKLDYSDYNGIYQFVEKIKSSSTRLNITSIQTSDTSGDAVTGGYIFKIDRPDSGEVSWQTTNGVPNPESGQKLVVVEPDADSDAPQQISYLEGYVQSFDTTLFSEKAAGFTTRNYRNYIDVGAWIDHHILNSLAFNDDGLRLSAFFFKDRDGKICAGPLWDFDRSLGSYDGRDANPRTWSNISYYFTRDWWGQLFQDPDFVQAWIDRWQQLRQGPLSDANLNGLADQMGAQIGNVAGARDAAKWTPSDNPTGGVYLNEIAAMKTWLTSTNAASLGRTNWIDSQLPSAPTISAATGVVAMGTTVTLGGSGTIVYTTNGTDPRPAGGSSTTSGTTYTGPIPINQTTVLTARRTGSFTPFPGAVSVNWGGITQVVYLVNETFAAPGDIAVSEINYNPLGPVATESAAAPGVTADQFEFIELRNIGNRTVNTYGMQFVDGKPFKQITLGPLSLAPGDFAVVVKNKAAFTARYGTAMSAKIVGEWSDGSLSNGGEEIQMLARDSSTIQDFSYSDGNDWPGRADGEGSTLEYIGTSYANADFNNPLNWRSSSEIHGSPGFRGAGPDTRVVINELLSHSNTPRVDAIELYNNDVSSVDISGWYISDTKNPEDATDYALFRIPNGTILPPGGYKVYTEADFNPNGTWNPNAGTPGPTEFAFDAHHGDDAWLIQADGAGNPLKFIDHWNFGAARSDESFGRWPNGTGQIYPMLTRTLLDENSGTYPRPGLGALNSLPRVGPVIINEVHHSPVSGNTDLEFIELRNTGTVTESLAHWELHGDVDFFFADTDTLAPGGLLVLVPFALTDTSKVNAFRTAYGISTSIPLEGAWTKGEHLGANGHVVLYRADSPSPDEPTFYPLLTEDETHYSSTSPWPNASSGPSLNRRGGTSIGDVSGAWKIDVPSPGTFGPTYTQWKTYYFPNGRAGGNDLDDPDHDGFSNALEYSLGTNPTVFDPAASLSPTLMQSVGANASYLFVYTKPVDRPGTTYRVQESIDLANWTAISDSVVSSNLELETRQAAVPINAQTPPHLFFRLQVTVAP